MDTVFNIREHVKNADTSNVRIQRTYDMINLVVYLLDGLRYDVYYTTPCWQILEGNDKFAGVVNGLPGALNENLVLKSHSDAIDAACKSIIAQQKSDLPDATMKEFLETEVLDQHTDLKVAFENLANQGFLLPFLLQTLPQKPEAVRVFEKGFLNPSDDPTSKGVGNLTERDFYTLVAKDHPKVHALVQEAKQASVIAAKINDLACRVSIQQCDSFPDLFCSTSGGVCTLGSDPFPE